MSNCNVPKLRLDGFEGEWTKDKAGNIFIAIDDRGYPQLPVLSATQNKGMIPRSMMGYKIHHDRDNEVGYKRVQIGDFVVHLRSFQGGFAHSYYDGITSPAYHVFRSRHEEEQDDVFWRFCFASPRFIYLLKFVTYGIRDGKSISFPEFLELELKYPSKREQHALSELFTNLDVAIDQHTDKHRVLQQTKTALMQRMFPQDGQTDPELRLDGFEGGWTHREVGDFVDVLAHNSLSRDQLTTSNTGIANVHYGDILIKFGAVLSVKAEVLPFVRDVENLKNVRGQTLIDGDIVFADAAEDASVGKCTEIRETFGCKVVAGLHTIPVRPREIFGDGFLGYAFNSDSFRNQLLPKMQGTKVSSISATVLKESRLALPPTVEEQQAIGAVFTKLDTLISAEAQLIEKLKHTKTALLQKMFV